MWAVLGVVRKLTVLVSPGKSFIDELVKEISPLEHKIALDNSATVLVIAAVVKTGNEQYQESQEREKVEEVTIVEDKYEAPRLIRAARRKSHLARKAQY